MISRKAKPKTITEYINAAPKEVRAKVREMITVFRVRESNEQDRKWRL